MRMERPLGTTLPLPVPSPSEDAAGISVTPAQPCGSVQPPAGEEDDRAERHGLVSQDYEKTPRACLNTLL